MLIHRPRRTPRKWRRTVTPTRHSYAADATSSAQPHRARTIRVAGILGVAFALALMAGCASQTTAPPTPTSAPVSAAVPTVATSTATASTAARATPSPAPPITPPAASAASPTTSAAATSSPGTEISSPVAVASASATPATSVLDWPTYHRDNARTGVDPTQESFSTTRESWRTEPFDGDIYA